MVAQILNNLPAFVVIQGITFDLQITQHIGLSALRIEYTVSNVESSSKHFDEWFSSGKWVNHFDKSYKQRYLIQVTEVQTDSQFYTAIRNIFYFLRSIGLVEGELIAKRNRVQINKFR